MTLAVMAMLALTPSAAAGDHADATVTVDGRDADGIDVDEPLELDAEQPVVVGVAVTNTGDEPLVVRSVRLRSEVFGLTFLAYETRVDMQVAPGETAERSFQLELLGLKGQATGLLPARIELLDAERNATATAPLAIDVQGSRLSVYGVFGLVIAAVTALGLARALVRLARGTLPANRWTRGVQFGAPGVGVGLVATITLSALRVFSPAPGLWITLVLACGGALFALGYLSPAPDADEDDEARTLEDASLGGRAGATVGEARATEPPDGLQPPSARAALRPPSARRESAVREHGP
jgi:hypothetical protein